MKIRKFLGNSAMKLVLVLAALFSISHGRNYDGFRAKYGNGTKVEDADNKTYFFKVPRTIQEAKNYKYIASNRPVGSPYPDQLQMLCAPGRILCPLFDKKDVLAGLQVAVPKEAISTQLKPENYFLEWKVNLPDGKTLDFWTATQYYINEETLKARESATESITSTIQNNVWVKGLDGQPMQIPTSETELQKTDFKKQNCVPNMGTHYYHKMSKTLTCDKDKPMLPWFPLVLKGELLGVGFQTFGDKDKVMLGDGLDWFENIPKQPRTTPLQAIPDAPECFLNASETFGRLSIHIYFIDHPWELKCEPADSVNPALAENPPTPTATSTQAPNGSTANEAGTKKLKGFANPIGDIKSTLLLAAGLLLLVACL